MKKRLAIVAALWIASGLMLALAAAGPQSFLETLAFAFVIPFLLPIGFIGVVGFVIDSFGFPEAPVVVFAYAVALALSIIAVRSNRNKVNITAMVLLAVFITACVFGITVMAKTFC